MVDFYRRGLCVSVTVKGSRGTRYCIQPGLGTMWIRLMTRVPRRLPGRESVRAHCRARFEQGRAVQIGAADNRHLRRGLSTRSQ